MKKKIVIHIGGAKTGSTAIQLLLGKENYSTTGGGILYPKTGRGVNYNHTQIWQALAVRPLTYAATQLLGKLGREVARSSESIVVISCEMFSYLNPETFKEVLDVMFPEQNYTIFQFIRPHPGLIVSNFTEALRNCDATVNIDNFVDVILEKGQITDQAGRVGNWKSVFGGAMEVHPFTHEKRKLGVVGTFFSAITRDTSIEYELGGERRNNAGIGQIRAEMMSLFLRNVDNLLATSDYRRFLIRTLKNFDTETIGKEKPIKLTRTELLNVEQVCRDDARKLDELLDTAHFLPALSEGLEQSFETRGKMLSEEQVAVIGSIADAAYGYFRSHPKLRLP